MTLMLGVDCTSVNQYGPLQSSTLTPTLGVVSRVTPRTGKPGKWEGIFQSGKSRNFDHTGKVRENHTKYWKTEEISDKY